MTMNSERRTPGESTFEAYLRSRGLTNFEYEKERPGKQKKPDYSIVLDGREYLFEVKDFDYVELAVEGGFDPYKRIRVKIGEARRKFKEFQGWPCSVVLFNNNAPLLQLHRPHVVLGAMEGNFGVTMLYDTKNGGIVPGSERPAFLDGGKMIRPHWSRPENTRISALITVWKLHVGKVRLMREYRLLLRSGAADPFPPESEFDFDTTEEQVGVIVWENRFARVPLPREMFRGDCDSRWGLDGGEIKRIYAGERLLAFEALDLNDPT
jgi:hypothetical protein